MNSRYQTSIEDTLLTNNEDIFSDPDGGSCDELLRSCSLTSLDFMIKGERMVSELCNISSDLPVDINTSKNTVFNRDHVVERFVGTQTINTMSANIQKHHKASQTTYVSEGPSGVSHNYDIYDETIPLQIIHLAVEACTVAESIAVSNKYRPCFKNIQTICEKTRSNVQQPDSAVAQLHSQGVPWVIKNFIFAFVRILDGWKGIKELMCEKHESFVKIEQKYYNPQIQRCFLKWQLITKQMLDHIYRTFKSLDEGFKAEQQALKKNVNYTLIQNRIKLQPKPAMKINSFPQYYEQTIQWNNGYGQHVPYVSPDMQAVAKWSTNPAITNTLSPIKSSFAGVTQLNCNNVYQSDSLNLCKNKELSNENDPKVIKGMGDSSNAIFQQHIRNDQIQFTNMLHKTICKNEFSTLSMNAKQSYQNNGFRMINNTSNITTAPDSTLGNCMNYQLRGSYLNEPSVQERFETLNHFNCDNALSNYDWPSTSHIYNAQMTESGLESACGLSVKGGTDLVYMKPGRYNIPIKVTEMQSSLLSQNQGTVETMVILNSELATVQNSMPLNTSVGSVTYGGHYIDQIQNIDLNIPSKSFDAKFSEINPSCKMDDKWEAAKGSVPELINNMSIHKSPMGKDSYYEVLPSKHTKLFLVEGQCTQNKADMDCIELPVESGSTPAVSYLENQSSNVVEDNSSIHNRLHVKNKPCQRILSQQNSIIDNAYGSNDIKRFRKKNKTSTSKHFDKKKKDLFCDNVKRMQYILDSIFTMEQSLKIDIDSNIIQAPQYNLVVKNPITFNNMSYKVCNVSHYTVDLLENDLRKLFLDVFAYLEIYPDPELRLKIEKTFQYFENLIANDKFQDNGNYLKDSKSGIKI